MALNIEPSDVSFAAAGGNAKHEVVNQTDSRHAFKVKCSDNQYYRVRPVYGFVNAKGRATIEIFRLAGPAKDDKIVVQWAEVPEEENDPMAPFKAGAQAGEVILPMKAT